MMMEWLGEPEMACRIERAITHALANGVKTPDLGGSSRTTDVTRAVAGYLMEEGGSLSDE
jgi:tartrate dehydrogenase/decarboxylase/D-malate dehydrogenase